MQEIRMSLTRIKAIIIHDWYYLKHSLEAFVDLFWWSLVSVVVFGFMSIFFAGGRSAYGAQYILIGMILWEIVRIGQYSISISILRDVWSRNLSNLFTTPLSVKEFLLAQMTVAFIETTVVFTLVSIIALSIYGFSIYQLGWYLIFAFLNLLLFAWASGVFILGLIIRYGTKLQALAWSLIWILQPLTAVFYPLNILPSFLQKLALFFPLTFVFEGARQRLLFSTTNSTYILIALLENIVYFIFAYWFFNRMFKKAKETGEFARLEQ